MKEVRDQVLHCAAAFIILLPTGPGIIGGIMAGLAIGLVRELTEESEISLPALKSALGSRLDLSFWALGGLLAGII